MLAAAFWFGIAADHKFLLWRQLYLDPAAGSAAGFVKRIGFFRDQPLELELTRYLNQLVFTATQLLGRSDIDRRIL
jgi:hypothetical protein